MDAINYNFEDYENFVAGTDKHVGNYLDKHMQHALGLSAETGEVTSKIYKRLRDGLGVQDEKDWEYELAKELGDVLWFVVRLANDVGFTFRDIARLNQVKLNQRVQNNTIHGSGDNR